MFQFCKYYSKPQNEYFSEYYTGRPINFVVGNFAARGFAAEDYKAVDFAEEDFAVGNGSRFAVGDGINYSR